MTAPQAPADGELTRSGASLAAAAPALIAAFPAVAVFFVWEWSQAGFAPTSWYPGALFVLGLLAVTAISLRAGPRELSRPALAALLCLAAYAGWSFLSIVWADVPGDAWDGANRTLLYASIYALFALLPWRAAGAGAVLGLFALGTAVVAAVFFIRAAAAVDPSSFFIHGRFSSPADYPNANCAIVLGAFWPAVFLASRREVTPLLRGLFLAAAGFLVQLAILPESRGSAVAVPVALALFVVLVPGRLRSVLALASVAVATLATLPVLLDVYASRHAVPDLRAALDDVALATALSFAALFVVGAATAYLDRRVELSARTSRRAGIAVATAGAAAVVAATVAFAVAYGSPYTRVAHAWSEFKAGETAHYGSSHFVGGLGSNRYDFWRVGVKQFRSAPAEGIGADNFAQGYLRDRRSGEEPLYPHSFEIRVLGQTGLVGAALVAAFIVFAMLAALRGRRAPGLCGAAAAAGTAAFAYWFLHGSVDWFWELPALTAPALAWLGLAAGLGPRPGRRPLRGDELGQDEVGQESTGPRVFPRPWAALAGVTVAAAAVSYALPWLAARNVVRAEAAWRTTPGTAFDRLNLARRLNPLSDVPDLTAGAIALRIGDHRRARADFLRALERNPKNWYPDLELGILDSLEQKRSRALRRLERARRKNPLEPVIGFALRRVRAGQQVSPQEVDAMFVRRVEERAS